MEIHKKIDNLLQGVTVRLEQLVNLQRESNKKGKDIKKNNILKNFLKYLATTLISFFIIIPTTFQINNVLSAENSEADYQINGVYDSHSTQFNIDFDTEHTPEQIYQYTYKISADLSIYKGKIKKLYLIYPSFENEAISEKNFYPINLSTKDTSLITYIQKSIPYFGNNNSPLVKAHFSDTVSYHSTKDEMTKPIYVLAIDTKNNMNISVIFINGHAQGKNKVTNKKLKIGETHLFPKQPKTKINFKTSTEMLGSYNPNNKDYLISSKKFKDDTNQIKTIFRQYFGTN